MAGKGRGGVPFLQPPTKRAIPAFLEHCSICGLILNAVYDIMISSINHFHKGETYVIPDGGKRKIYRRIRAVQK